MSQPVDEVEGILCTIITIDLIRRLLKCFKSEENRIRTRKRGGPSDNAGAKDLMVAQATPTSTRNTTPPPINSIMAVPIDSIATSDTTRSSVTSSQSGVPSMWTMPTAGLSQAPAQWASSTMGSDPEITQVRSAPNRPAKIARRKRKVVDDDRHLHDTNHITESENSEHPRISDVWVIATSSGRVSADRDTPISHIPNSTPSQYAGGLNRTAGTRLSQLPSLPSPDKDDGEAAESESNPVPASISGNGHTMLQGHAATGDCLPSLSDSAVHMLSLSGKITDSIPEIGGAHSNGGNDSLPSLIGRSTNRDPSIAPLEQLPGPDARPTPPAQFPWSNSIAHIPRLVMNITFCTPS